MNHSMVPAGNRTFERQGAVFVALLLLGAAYLVFSPVWLPNIAWYRYDNARLMQLSLLVTAALAVAVPGIATALVLRWQAIATLPRGLILLFVGGGALSAAASAAPHVGALEVSLVTLLLLFAISMSAVVSRIGARAEQTLAVAIISGAGLLVLQFWITQCLLLIEGEPFIWTSPFLQFANVRFFSQYQAYTLLVVLLPLFLFKVGKVGRLLIYLIAANLWSLQWMVGTRAVWIGLLAAVTAVAVFGGEGRLKWIRTHLSLIIVGGFIALVFTQAVMPFAEAEPLPRKNALVGRNWNSMNERIVMARGAVELVTQRPLLGIGPGQFGMNYDSTLAAHPHNSALQLLSEYGVVAGGAGIGLLLCIVVFAIRRIRANVKLEPTDVALSAPIIMGLTESLFSGNLIMPHSQILLCVLLGWLLGRRAAVAVQHTQAEARSSLARTTMGSVAMLAAVVTVILATEYHQVIGSMPFWLQPRPPHFWQYGRFDAW